MTLTDKIAQAQRHVDNGRLIIECQRETVFRYQTRASFDLLEKFEQTQEIFEMDLAALLKRRIVEEYLEELLRPRKPS